MSAYAHNNVLSASKSNSCQILPFPIPGAGEENVISNRYFLYLHQYSHLDPTNVVRIANILVGSYLQQMKIYPEIVLQTTKTPRGILKASFFNGE